MITKIYLCNANAHIYFQVLFASSLTPLFRVISRSDTDEPADRGRRPFRRCPLTSGSFSGGQTHSRRHGTLPSPGHPVRVSAVEESQTRKRSKPYQFLDKNNGTYQYEANCSIWIYMVHCQSTFMCHKGKWLKRINIHVNIMFID